MKRETCYQVIVDTNNAAYFEWQPLVTSTNVGARISLSACTSQDTPFAEGILMQIDGQVVDNCPFDDIMTHLKNIQSSDVHLLFREDVQSNETPKKKRRYTWFEFLLIFSFYSIVATFISLRFVWNVTTMEEGYNIISSNIGRFDYLKPINMISNLQRGASFIPNAMFKAINIPTLPVTPHTASSSRRDKSPQTQQVQFIVPENSNDDNDDMSHVNVVKFNDIHDEQ